MIEAARWAAVKAGVFKNKQCVSHSVRRACIDYTGQPHAGDSLDVAVWWDEKAEVMGFELTVGEEVVATAVLSFWAEPAMSSL